MRRNVGPRSKKIVESTAAITTETRCESHPALGRIPSTKKGSPRGDSLKKSGVGGGTRTLGLQYHKLAL